MAVLRRCYEYGEFHGTVDGCHCDADGGFEEVPVVPEAEVERLQRQLSAAIAGGNDLKAEVERKETRIQELEGLLRKSRLDHLSTCGELENATADSLRLREENARLERQVVGIRAEYESALAAPYELPVLRHAARRAGWWLMSWPTGIRRPWQWWLRWGPYRWGADLHTWGNHDAR